MFYVKASLLRHPVYHEFFIIFPRPYFYFSFRTFTKNSFRYSFCLFCSTMSIVLSEIFALRIEFHDFGILDIPSSKNVFKIRVSKFLKFYQICWQSIIKNICCNVTKTFFVTNTSPSIRDRRNKNIWIQILMKFDENFCFENEIFVKFWF